jgi:hypothetical protein
MSVEGRMSVAERIEAALTADECAGAATLLVALVYSLSAEGMSKQAIGVAYYNARRRLQEAGRNDAADAIGDVLAVLMGSCSASSRLLPDEPDVRLGVGVSAARSA